jgi:hypothetical protein
VLLAAGRRRIEEAIETGVAFAVGVTIPTALYLVSGGSAAALVDALRFHSQKPIGLEGVVGTVIMLVQWAVGLPLRITPGFGVHGFTSDLPLLTNSVLELLWIVPTGLLFLAMVRAFWRRGFGSPALPFTLLLVFVVFAKVLNPQYLWWFVVFLPWIARAWWSSLPWTAVLVIAVASLLVTQVVYPLYYTEFLDWFSQRYESPALFYASIVRNVLLLVLLALTMVAFYRQSRAETNPDRPARLRTPRRSARAAVQADVASSRGAEPAPPRR